MSTSMSSFLVRDDALSMYYTATVDIGHNTGERRSTGACNRVANCLDHLRLLAETKRGQTLPDFGAERLDLVADDHVISAAKIFRET